MNRTFISQKLAQIAMCVGELRPVALLSLAAFRSQPAHFRLAERDVQLIVDSAVDVNNEIIVAAGRKPPQRYFDTFLELVRLRVLPRALARRLAGSTGLRNRIVHQYETVDMTVLHRALRGFMRDYQAYVGATRRAARV